MTKARFVCPVSFKISKTRLPPNICRHAMTASDDTPSLNYLHPSGNRINFSGFRCMGRPTSKTDK
jgi:hypothetical protein